MRQPPISLANICRRIAVRKLRQSNPHSAVLRAVAGLSQGHPGYTRVALFHFLNWIFQPDRPGPGQAAYPDLRLFLYSISLRTSPLQIHFAIRQHNGSPTGFRQ